MGRRQNYYHAARRKYYSIGSDCVLYHAYWDGTAVDHSISGNNGTVYGASFVPGLGLLLDGEDDKIILASKVFGTLTDKTQTLVMWYNKSSSKGTGNQIPISDPVAWHYAFYQGTTFSYTGGGFTFAITDTVDSPTCVCLTYDQVTLKVNAYQNGVATVDSPQDKPTGLYGGYTVIGAFSTNPASTSYTFMGMIYEIIITSIAWTPAQVTDYYNFTRTRYGL